MASESCDGCGRDVSVGAGLETLWTFEGARTDGVTVEFEDGTEHFLCFECTGALPEEPTAEDVAAIEPVEPEPEPSDAVDDDGGVRYVFGGLALGAVLGIALGIAFEDTGFWLSLGLALGFAAGLLVGRITELRQDGNE